jgi:hypothetical protein
MLISASNSAWLLFSQCQYRTDPAREAWRGNSLDRQVNQGSLTQLILGSLFLVLFCSFLAFASFSFLFFFGFCFFVLFLLNAFFSAAYVLLLLKTPSSHHGGGDSIDCRPPRLVFLSLARLHDGHDFPFCERLFFVRTCFVRVSPCLDCWILGDVLASGKRSRGVARRPTRTEFPKIFSFNYSFRLWVSKKSVRMCAFDKSGFLF